jgi:DnaK suppressor protein
MKHLSATDRNALRQQLEAMKRQVLDELLASAPSAQPELRAHDHEVTSHADEAEAERMDDVRFAEIEVDRARLDDIELALARMADGRYGVCADCRAEIPRLRLLAQPTAIRCAPCQAAAEKHRRR